MTKMEGASARYFGNAEAGMRWRVKWSSSHLANALGILLNIFDFVFYLHCDAERALCGK